MISRQDLPRRPAAALGDLTALVREFESVGIGPIMLAEVREIAYFLVPRYNASVYSEIGNWRHGFDDLVQDVVTHWLLGDGQARYLVETSKTIKDFRRLLTRQVKRCLARRRTRTVIDNVLDRSRPLLDQPPFARSMRHLQVTYFLDGLPREERAAKFFELRAASIAIRPIPQITTSKRDRAPEVYKKADLVRVLTRIGEALPNAFTIGELDRILRLTLPHLLPGVLDLDNYESEVASDENEQTNNSDRVLAAVGRIREEFNDDLLLVLACKVAGVSDLEVSRHLGVSRRTATNRKRSVISILEKTLGTLTDQERRACLEAMRPELQAALSQT
ncbi:MAG: hypothetical protein ABJH68_12735 [Ilumatobacter sp.]|uniref:hypothetical protein n=1 Tax=Ilumatobacter sp. TaxID=1967498 RepID=UPI00329977AD